MKKTLRNILIGTLVVSFLLGGGCSGQKELEAPRFSPKEAPRFGPNITRFGCRRDTRYLRRGPSFDRVKLYVDLNNNGIYDREFEFQYIDSKHKSKNVWPNFVRIYNIAMTEDDILNYKDGFIEPELMETINFNPHLSFNEYRTRTQKLLLKLGLDPRVLADMRF